MNVGHGRQEIADAASAQMSRLASYSAFGAFANEPAITLAERIADYAHDVVDDPRVFFGLGGGDAIDTAAKPARRYFAACGEPDRTHPDRPHSGLPRHARPGDQHRGDHGQSGRHGPARPGHEPRAARLRRGAGGRDRAPRPGPRGGRLRRAGDRRRRPPPAAPGLFGDRRRSLRASRRAARDRCRDLCIRAPGDLAGRRSLRTAARHDHLRRGRHQRLPAHSAAS